MGNKLQKQNDVRDLVTYCRKNRPHIHFYKQQIKSLDETAHQILKNEVDLILPQFSTNRKEMRGIITSLITGFIGLTDEGISSFLHNRRHKALHKVVKVLETKSNIQHNKLMHLENSILIYGVYSTETLEKLINTVHCMHNTKTLHEKIFAGQLTAAYRQNINSHCNQVNNIML